MRSGGTMKMTAELLAAEAQWLPQFAGKRLRPTPTILVPPGTKHAEVPLDPALAIGKRFGTLVTQGGEGDRALEGRPDGRNMEERHATDNDLHSKAA